EEQEEQEEQEEEEEEEEEEGRRGGKDEEGSERVPWTDRKRRNEGQGRRKDRMGRGDSKEEGETGREDE
ncbi:hypothetical protein N9L68_03820, partial [bacterium]|nr:hypothetical protein [bacterium]